jgi:hypothetical protein
MTREVSGRTLNLWQLVKGLPLLANTDTLTIMGFNDAYGRRFVEILEVVRQARQLAMMAAVSHQLATP